MGLFRFFRNLNLGVKLSVVVVLALGVLLTAIIIVVDGSVGNLIAQTGRHRVEQEAELVRSRFAEAEKALSADTKLLANTPGLIEALANRDATVARTALAVGAAPIGLQEAVVVDTTGARFVKSVEVSEQHDAEQEDTSTSLSLLGIETGNVTIEENEQGELEFRLAAALPLRNEAGEIVGGLITRRRVDDAFLEEINYSRQDVHILLIVDEQILAQSTRHSMEEEQVEGRGGPEGGTIAEFDGILLDETAIGRAIQGEIVTASDLEYTTDGVPHAIAYVPLTVGGTTRAVVGVLFRSVVRLSEPIHDQAGHHFRSPLRVGHVRRGHVRLERHRRSHPSIDRCGPGRYPGQSGDQGSGPSERRNRRPDRCLQPDDRSSTRDVAWRAGTA
jgi:hypothetical protein